MIISGRLSAITISCAAAHEGEIERGRRTDAPGSSDDRDLHARVTPPSSQPQGKNQIICVGCVRGCAVRPRGDLRRLARVRADLALREPRLDRDPAACRPAGRLPLRARAARELRRRHGDRLGDRARRARARDPAYDRRPRQRGRRARDRARQPRAARGRRRPAGPAPPGLRALPRGQAAWPRRRVSRLGRPARAPAGRARGDRARRPRGCDRERSRARDRADGRLGGRSEPGRRAGRGAPRRARAAADGAAVAELAGLIEARESPALVVGAGADDPETWRALVALAERLAARSGRSRSARAPGSPRITRSSPGTCRPIASACARRSRRTTSCSPSALRCSGSTRSSRPVRRGGNERRDDQQRPGRGAPEQRPTSRCSRRPGRLRRARARGSGATGEPPRRSRCPPRRRPRPRASRCAQDTCSRPSPSASRATRS